MRQRTEEIKISVLMVHVDSPILPFTMDLEDSVRNRGVFGVVVIDTLEFKFKNVAGVKS